MPMGLTMNEKQVVTGTAPGSPEGELLESGHRGRDLLTLKWGSPLRWLTLYRAFSSLSKYALLDNFRTPGD
jgi:hypothetical protein